MKLAAKFGENRINGSEIIQVFVNFKIAAGGHLGFRYFQMFDLFSHFVSPSDRWRNPPVLLIIIYHLVAIATWYNNMYLANLHEIY
jgi:hypothetical protein